MSLAVVVNHRLGDNSAEVAHNKKQICKFDLRQP
jgi:tRNA(Ile)-lysidine synthase TilS/MesJ